MTASAPAWTPASASRSAIRTPLHQALPIRSPPTGLETQQIVTQSSVSSAVEQVVVADRRSPGRPSRGSAAASRRGRRRARPARCRSGRSRRSGTRHGARPAGAPVSRPGGHGAAGHRQPQQRARLVSTARRARPTQPAAGADGDRGDGHAAGAEQEPCGATPRSGRAAGRARRRSGSRAAPSRRSTPTASGSRRERREVRAGSSPRPAPRPPSPRRPGGRRACAAR